jgi:flagellar protein FlgJ
MYDKMSADTRTYTNIQGLDELRANVKKNPNAAKKEVTQQFEAILMQMMLKSMRDANQAFASDLFGSDQMGFYQDLFDKQLTLSLSNHGIGIAEAIERNMKDQHLGDTPDPDAPDEALQPVMTAPTPITIPAKITTTPAPVAVAAVAPVSAEVKTPEKTQFDTPESFIKQLWPTAKMAAKMLGANPEILLAQAALETNWGKKILPHNANTSSFNLFNIKADGHWASKTTTMDSLEERQGVLVKEKSAFRSYESFKDSFLDYVNLLKQNSRYSGALQHAESPEKFVHALQDAGYATDSQYASKIMKIFGSQSFQNLIAKMQ